MAKNKSVLAKQAQTITRRIVKKLSHGARGGEKFETTDLEVSSSVMDIAPKDAEKVKAELDEQLIADLALLQKAYLPSITEEDEEEEDEDDEEEEEDGEDEEEDDDDDDEDDDDDDDDEDEDDEEDDDEDDEDADEDDDDEEEEADDFGIKISKKELEGIEVHINNLTMAKNKKQFAVAVKKMKKGQKKFSDTQSEYLIAYAQKRKSELKK